MKEKNINVEVEVEREYNLGGYRNALKIKRKITGPIDDVQENIENINKVIYDIEVAFGSGIASSRVAIKKAAKEAYEDDGKVIKKKDVE